MLTTDQVRQAISSEWCAVLRVEQVHEKDEFFSAGGDSISALQLAGRVEDRLGIKFPLDTLFLDGTFSAVIEACAEAELKS
ncbi:MAG TPA: phosphopantetheine-binding protein [Streptosporangiaceae bacterium]|nr:phosphopantetheine-binding protein [Streptosporangiaceae bacterium]